MINLDELLQKNLSAIEDGAPLESVLAELPPEAQELVPMLRLAAAARTLPYPRMAPEAVHAQRLRVSEAAVHSRSLWPSLPSWLTRTKAVFAMGAGLGILALVVMAISFIMAGPVSAKSARLADPQGMVEVASSANNEDWHFIQADEDISQGQRVRTYAASTVSLVFFDGSRTVIGQNSDLTLTILNGVWGNVLRVQLTQNSGLTTNDVVPLRSSGFFLVDTPSGQASVHGTRFNVDVNPEGATLFAVTHGSVQVKNSLSEVTLASGQATAVLPGKDLEQPGYQFTLQGAITSIQAEQWIVDNIPFHVTDQTDILGTYTVGELVLVKGRILAPGNWVADSISPAPDAGQKITFTGVIQEMPGVPGTWQIGGMAIKVNDQTKLGDDLKVGVAVEATAVMLPGGIEMLATEIEPLEEPEKPTATPTDTKTITVTVPSATSTATSTVTVTPSSTPTATVTVTGTINPSATSTPVTATPTPSQTLTATVVPKNDSSRCENRTKQQPEALRLAHRFNVSYDEIMGWFCKGFGFGEIDLAYDLSHSSGMPVSQIFDLRSSGLGWGQIKKQLSDMGTPDDSEGKDKDKKPKK